MRLPSVPHIGAFISFLAVPAMAQVTFAPAKTISGNRGSALAIAAADVTGDTVKDLIIAESTLEGFYLEEGIGGGAFLPPVRIDTNSGVPERLAAGDFDGDGDVDLAAILKVGVKRSFAVLTNGPSGAWSTRIIESDIGTARDLLVSDTDGDGDLDVVINLVGPGVRLYQNNGPTFAASMALAADASDMKLVDLDDDGFDDILFAGGLTGEWSVVLGSATGAFGTPQSFLPATLRFFPNLDAGDLDGDGDADLMLTVPAGTPGGQSRLILVESLGALQFAPAVDVPVIYPVESGDLQLHDFDGDGLVEPAYTRSTPPFFSPQAVVLMNLGGFQFGTEQTLFPGNFALLTSSNELRFVEVTGDGRLDGTVLSVGGDSPGLYASQPVGTSRWFVPVAPLLDEFAISAEELSVDVDLDGDDDILSIAAGTGDVFLFRNRGGLRFDREELVAAGTAEQGPVTAADFNGDTRLDLLMVSSNSLSAVIRFGTGPGTFTAPISIASWPAGVLTGVELTDLAQDGDIDIVATIQESSRTRVLTWTNDGSGTAFIESQISALPGSRELALGDLDGDGLKDIALVSALDGTLYLGQQGGSFGGGTVFDGSPSGVRNPLIVDADLDGDLDLMALNEQNALSWAEADFPNGLGVFRPFTALPVPGYRNLLAVDLNGDGLGDFIGSERNLVGSPRIRSFTRTAIGSFVFGEVASATTAAMAPAATDFDQDGDLDVLFREQNRLLVTEGLATPSAGLPWIPCSAGAINSSGLRGEVVGSGSASVSSDNLRLRAIKLPSGQFGLFIGSATSALPAPVMNSLGQLCLGGSIGRYDGAGQIGSTGAAGTFVIDLDPTSLETSTGTVPAMAGQPWYFQAWHRDVGATGPTSNFTGTLRIVFTP